MNQRPLGIEFFGVALIAAVRRGETVGTLWWRYPTLPGYQARDFAFGSAPCEVAAGTVRLNGFSGKRQSLFENSALATRSLDGDLDDDPLPGVVGADKGERTVVAI